MITNKFCFVHLERTGGQTIRHWVNELKKITNITVIKDIGESSARVLPQERPFTFGFIRNPFEWYLSRYLYYCSRREKGETKSGGQFSRKIDELIIKAPLSELPSFEKFFWRNMKRDWTRKAVKAYFKLPVRKLPFFNMSHTVKDAFYDVNGNLMLDYLGDTANLNKHIKQISKKLNLPYVDLPQLNSTKHGIATSYYTPEMIKFVKETDEFIFKLLDEIS